MAIDCAVTVGLDELPEHRALRLLVFRGRELPEHRSLRLLVMRGRELPEHRARRLSGLLVAGQVFG